MSPVLEVSGLSKAYRGTQALDDVSLAFEPGRVHALVGKNGAGKSTLVRLLSGAVTPDAGHVALDGKVVRLRSPRQALLAGIATVHQELSLIPALSVAENVLLGRLPHRRGVLRPQLDWRAMRARASALLEDMNVRLDVRRRVSSLSLAEQQVVEIVRALSFEPRVVLLDEPTSGLARAEVGSLFALVRHLASRGVAVVHVTHRLQELAQVADVVSCLRDGKHVGTIPVAEATPRRLVELMLGEEVLRSRPRPAARAAGPAVLGARHLACGDRLADVSFDLHAGEVLGIAGMLGSGRTELLMTLFGAMRAARGDVLVGGEVVRRPTPRRMKAMGIALVPEDRKRQGLALPMSVLDNASLASLSRLARHGVLRRRWQRQAVEPVLADLHVTAGRLTERVSTLSGGNQQKVVIGRWLLERPRAVLLDEPTRGIDVHARAQVFETVRRLASEAVACLIVSSELEELLEGCHRILVMRHGRVAAEVRPGETSAAQLYALAMGSAA